MGAWQWKQSQALGRSRDRTGRDQAEPEGWGLGPPWPTLTTLHSPIQANTALEDEPAPNLDLITTWFPWGRGSAAQTASWGVTAMHYGSVAGPGFGAR